MKAMHKIKVAMIQMKVGTDKAKNIAHAQELIKQAASKNAQLICLPECFNSPYGIQHFPSYAEMIPGETSQMLSTMAKDHSIYLCGGSIPERDHDHLYNTSLVYGPNGDLVAKHRKVHLFDVDVPGGIKFKESDVLSPGNKLTVFNVDALKVGLGICYDIRFPEMSSKYSDEGCQLLLYPAAFNMTTGPKHFQLLQRARAMDHQLYVATCSPARDETASYIAWGYSAVCNPWAEVIAEAGHVEEIIYAEIDTELSDTVRKAIPVRNQKRHDLY